MLWPTDLVTVSRSAPIDLDQEVQDWCDARRIALPPPELVHGFYAPLATWVSRHVSDGTLILGLNGAPGTGKSALADLLCRLLWRLCRFRAVTLSLDDLYLGGAARRKRAEAIHPLLATRGVPGTHDVGLGLEVLRSLREGASLSLPRFDKAQDERCPHAQWPAIDQRVDVVILEGWCLGARSQPANMLDVPVNDFEREYDSDGSWRWYVNRQLGGAYQALFAEIDALVMLKPPSFDQVFEWREHQEAQLRATSNSSRVMSTDDVRAFVRQFERLTRFTWDEMPMRADAVIHLDVDQQPERVDLGDASATSRPT